MNEWQPIETAPRDGVEILLFARGQHNDVYRGVGQWSEQSKDWFGVSQFALPTGWLCRSLPDENLIASSTGRDPLSPLSCELSVALR